jgi:hypothetical protein
VANCCNVATKVVSKSNQAMSYLPPNHTMVFLRPPELMCNCTKLARAVPFHIQRPGDVYQVESQHPAVWANITHGAMHRLGIKDRESALLLPICHTPHPRARGGGGGGGMHPHTPYAECGEASPLALILFCLASNTLAACRNRPKICCPVSVPLGEVASVVWRIYQI